MTAHRWPPDHADKGSWLLHAARTQRMTGVRVGWMVSAAMVMVIAKAASMAASSGADRSIDFKGVPGADAFHVMVVALLRQADVGLEAQDLGAVFAHLAIHRDIA